MKTVTLTEDRPDGHTMEVVVSNKTLKKLQDLATGGGFKRFSVDIVKDTKQAATDPERFYEFFDRIYLFKSKEARITYFADPAEAL